MTINTDCKVTNSTGAEVLALNAFNSSTNVATNSTKQGYEQELKPLKFGSSATLGDGQSGTITLDETYTDSKGQTRQALIYDLMFSQPASLFPVSVHSVMLDFKTQSYPDLELPAADKQVMTKAYAFCQNIMTSPTSNMSKDFQAAMTAAFKLSSVSEINAAMAAFWNKYPSFAGLDFKSYVAMSTYLRAFAYLWGMDLSGKPGQTYYVYAASADGKSVEAEGQIVFAQKSGAPSPADPTDPDSGFDISYTPTGGSPTALKFEQGQLIDDKGAIGLNGSFGFAGTFTSKKGDTTVWPIFSGTLVGRKVMAIPLAPESGWSKFWSGLSFSKLLDYFLKAMGLWMALDFLKQKLTGKEKKLADDEANDNEGNPPDEQQQQEADEAGEQIGEDAQQADQGLAERAGGDGVQVPDEDGFDAAADAARPEAADAYSSIAEDNLSGGIDSANTQLEALAEIEVTEQIEEAGSNLADAQSSLDAGELSDAASSLGDVNQALPQIVEDFGDQVSQELADQVQEAVAAQEEAAEVAEETDESGDDAGSGEEEPFDDPVVPEI